MRITVAGENDVVQATKRINDQLRETGRLLQANQAKRKADNTQSSSQQARSGSTPRTNAAGLRREIAEAKALDQEYKSLVTEAGRLKAEQAEVNREIREQARLFEQSKSAAGSYRQVNAELVRLRNSYRELSRAEREGIAGKQTIRRIDDLDRELKDLDRDMGIYARNVGNYESAFNRVGAVFGRIAGIAGISLGAEEIVNNAAVISDSIAGVEKVAGLATEQVRELAEELKLRDTRTSLEDQLKIAEVGARSGINADNLGVEEAKRQLTQFVDAIDTANLALGDQFDNNAEQVASTLTGLRNVLFDFRPNGDADVGGDLLRIGNALNYLETQGNSTAAVIADFVGRIGGIAVPFGASEESIFALSTTLDELEVSAERGATAVSTTLGKLAAAPEQFAELVVGAGLVETSEEFVALVNDDIVTALTLVAGAVSKGSEENSDYSQSLKDLGITGAREVEVFAKLGGATERYTELLGISAEALDNTNSLVDEAAKKNNTLGADLEKLKNRLNNAFNSGEVQDGLRTIVRGVTDLIAYIIEATKFIAENRVELGLLAAALLVYEGSVKASAVAARSAAIAQAFFNKVAQANIYVKLASLVLLLASGLATLYRRNEEVRTAVNRVIDEFRDLYENSLLLKVALGPVGLAFKIIFDTIREGPGVLNSYADSFRTFAENVPRYLNIVELKVKRFGLTVADALNFGIGQESLDRKLAEVEARIDEEQAKIEKSNSDFRQREIDREIKAIEVAAQAKKEAQEKELADQKEAARKKREAEAEAARIAREERAKEIVANRGAELQRVKDKILAGKALTAAEKAIYDALSEIEQQALQEQLKRNKEAAAERKRLQEQQKKDREAAALRIIDLENQAISNRFERSRAEAITTANRDIASLVGDPEQVKQQADLIRAALQRTLSNIATDRSLAYEEARNVARDFNREMEALQASNVADEPADRLKLTERNFDAEKKALERQIAFRENELVKSYRTGEVNLKEYTQRRAEIQGEAVKAQQQLLVRRNMEVGALDAEVTATRLAKLESDFQLEQGKIEDQNRKRLEQIAKLLADGDLTEKEAAEARESAEALRREEEIEALREFETDKLDVAADFAERRLQAQEDEGARAKALALRIANNLAEVEQAQKDVVQGAFVDLAALTGEFLASQEKDFKSFLKSVILLSLDALEKYLLLSISKITIGSLASPESIATAGAAGVAKAAALTLLVKAAFAGVKAAVSTFEHGGAIGGAEDGMRGNWVGGQVPMHSGVAVGRSHAAGGIRQGTVEIEGGEYVIQNGPERYIVNKKSTAAHRPLLDMLSKNPNIFSPLRRHQVSAINAAGGHGIRFAAGGVIGGGSAPLPPPLALDGTTGLNSRNSGAYEVALQELSQRALYAAERATDLAEAANARIDRLRVYNDPAEVVKYGQDKIRTESRGEL